MNINNQVATTTSFKHVDPQVMLHFGEYSNGFRKNLAQHYDRLNKSDVVDLVLNKSDQVVLRIKKKYNMDEGYSLSEGLELHCTPMTSVRTTNTKVICSSVSSPSGYESVVMDFGFPEFNQIAKKIIQPAKDGKIEDILPQLGVLIDAASRIAEPIEQIKVIFNDKLSE